MKYLIPFLFLILVACFNPLANASPHLVAPDGYELAFQHDNGTYLEVVVNAPPDTTLLSAAVALHDMIKDIDEPVHAVVCVRAPLEVRHELGFDATECENEFWFNVGDPDAPPGTNIIKDS